MGTRAVVVHAVRARLLLALALGGLLVGLGALTGALWPPLRDTFADLPDEFDRVLADTVGGGGLGTPTGWVTAQMLTVVAPGAVIAVAVVAAARGVAGEEESKSLGVLLSLPLRRTTFVLAQAAGVGALVALLTGFLGVGLIAANLLGDLGLTTAGVVGACLHTSLLGVVFGAVTVVAAAATGTVRLSAAIGAGSAVLAFASATFLPLLAAVAGLARSSPWYYFSSADPLADGADPVHLLILGAGTTALLTAAVVVFRRRDLRG